MYLETVEKVQKGTTQIIQELENETYVGRSKELSTFRSFEGEFVRRLGDYKC